MATAAGPAVSPVGLLTSMHRDTWAAARARLLACGAHNEAVFQSVGSAAFVLCLDRPLPAHATASDQLRHVLTGESQAGNRWCVLHGASSWCGGANLWR
jgi:carnitine O-acetyltransferase